MKKMRCKDMGGACDMLITGNTPDEMGEHCAQHGMLMVKQGDQDHIDAMQRMQDMSPGEFASFWAEFRRNFEDADEA